MLSIDNLSNLEAICMLVFIESRMDVTYQMIVAQCAYFCHHHIFKGDMFSLKYHFSSNTNRVDSFVVAVNRKIHIFSHLMALRYRGYTTYGIRAGVETLGPNWAQNDPTGFTLELHGY